MGLLRLPNLILVVLLEKTNTAVLESLSDNLLSVLSSFEIFLVLRMMNGFLLKCIFVMRLDFI